MGWPVKMSYDVKLSDLINLAVIESYSYIISIASLRIWTVNFFHCLMKRIVNKYSIMDELISVDR